MTREMRKYAALFFFLAAFPFLIIGGALLWLATHVEDED